MYTMLEYMMYVVLVAGLAAMLFGASVLALVTKESASRIAQMSLGAINGATRHLIQRQSDPPKPDANASEPQDS